MMIKDSDVTDVKPLTFGAYPGIGFLVEGVPMQFSKFYETAEDRDAAIERIRAARQQKELQAEADRALQESKKKTEIELDRMREAQREQLEVKNSKRRQRAAERRKAEQEKPRADIRPITLKDGQKWKPTLEDFDDWTQMYPDVDVKREFDNMRRYCLDKPQKRKTQRGIKRFVTNWLERVRADQKADTGKKRTGWASGMETQDYDIDAIEQELLGQGAENVQEEEKTESS